jgi:hypothetical protein
MAESIGETGDSGYTLLQKGEFPGGRYAYIDAVQDMKTILEFVEND